MAVDLLHEADELRRCVASLRERLAEVGVSGSAELLSLDPTDPALAAIERDAVSAALACGHRIVAELASLLGCLQAVRESKERLDRAHTPRAS